jgi:hypothetical protein
MKEAGLTISKYIREATEMMDRVSDAKSRTALKKKKEKAMYLGLPTYLVLGFLRFSALIFENIFMVFLGSSCRETAKKTR